MAFRSNIPGLSQDHDGVAVGVSHTVETLQGGGFSKEERALIDQDELRVFDMLTPEFSYYCTERVLKAGQVWRIWPDPLPRAQGRSVVAMTSRRGSTANSPRRAGRAIDASVVRYAHDTPIHDPLPRFAFDAITDCWFDSEDDAVRAALGPAIPQALADMCDTGRSVTMLTHAFRRRAQDVGLGLRSAGGDFRGSAPKRGRRRCSGAVEFPRARMRGSPPAGGRGRKAVITPQRDCLSPQRRP